MGGEQKKRTTSGGRAKEGGMGEWYVHWEEGEGWGEGGGRADKTGAGSRRRQPAVEATKV